jgi:DNA-binding NtrC family response regulator
MVMADGAPLMSLSGARILVVDDEPAVADVIARIARALGHEAIVADSVDAAIERLAESTYDVVLTDLRLGDRDGLELLRHVQERNPDVPVVVITGQATVDSAMEAIRAGAYDYISKPPDRDALGALLKRAIDKRRLAEEVKQLQREIQTRELEPIAGNSPDMLEVYKTVARVAPSRTNVLILGESGTGKELVARTLHHQSPRAERRFVPVNVSAIPEGLLESELFGHTKGSFTGATAARRGLFEEAHQGTLFLDEIGDLSLPLQAKLLRVIQEHRIKPVGGNEEIEVDVRLVVATHRDLEDMVRRGLFREDLYYRLNVVSISLPPLRKRHGDIELLIEHFRHKYEHDTGLPAPEFSREARQRLLDYDWPGNIRELENVVERAILLSTHGVVTVEALPPRVLAAPRGRSGLMTLDEMIEQYVRHVVEHTGGNLSRAAQILGISRRTLHRMAERKRRTQEGSDKVTQPTSG